MSDAFDQLVDFFDQAKDTPVHREFRNALLTLADPQVGARVLDLGCGAGPITLDMLRTGRLPVAVDRSFPMLARTGENALGMALGMPYRVGGDVMRLPFRDGMFDLAISMLVLHTLPEPRAGLREMARMVRPGGVVAVLTPSLLMEPQAAEAYARRYRLSGLSIDFIRGCAASSAAHYRFSPSALVDALSAAGLVGVRVKATMDGLLLIGRGTRPSH